MCADHEAQRMELVLTNRQSNNDYWVIEAIRFHGGVDMEDSRRPFALLHGILDLAQCWAARDTIPKITVLRRTTEEDFSIALDESLVAKGVWLNALSLP